MSEEAGIVIEEVETSPDDGGGEDGPPGWLTTFADLMSLLLTFFILLLSFAELNQKKFHSVVESIHLTFKGNPGPPGKTALNSEEQFHIPDKSSNPSTNAEKNATSMFIAEIHDAIDNDLNSQKLSWEKTSHGVKIKAEADFIFLPQTTIITEKAKVIIRKIIRRTRYFEFGLTATTYTDDRPINTPLFSSNWNFSLRRSTSLIRFILKESKIPSSWAKAVGGAHSEPILPNTNEYNRRMNNRVILDYKVNKKVGYKRNISTRKEAEQRRRVRRAPKVRFFNSPKEAKATSSKSPRIYGRTKR